MRLRRASAAGKDPLLKSVPPTRDVGGCTNSDVVLLLRSTKRRPGRDFPRLGQPYSTPPRGLRIVSIVRFTIDPVTRGWAAVTSAGVVRLALGFVASLVIARVLGPSAFGIYAVLAATVGIVGTLAEGGLTEAAVLRIAAVWPRDVSAAAHRAKSFFWLRMALAVSIVAIGCALAAPLADRLLSGFANGLVRWALLGIVATAVSAARFGATLPMLAL